MGYKEDLKKMQEQGLSEQEVGIKSAVVEGQGDDSATISQYSQDSGMEQSVMSNSASQEEVSYAQVQKKSDTPEQNYEQNVQAEQPQAEEQNYASYQYGSDYQSSDNISEIAEQIFDEKMSSLGKKIDSLSESRTEFEAKLLSLDSRLSKIEKVIDRLQLSILQKVGEYITNVEDIKKEIIETQKSFKYISKNNNSN